MLHAIETGTDPLISGTEGRKTVEFISAVYQSAFTGTRVQLPMSAKDPFYTREGLLGKATRFNEKKKALKIMLTRE